MTSRLVYIGSNVGGLMRDRIDNRFGAHEEVAAAGLPEWNPRAFPQDESDPDYPEARGKWIEEQLALGAGEEIMDDDYFDRIADKADEQRKREKGE